MFEPRDRPTILIVDDTPENIKVLGEELRSAYKIKIATDGEKALRIALSATPPDLILLDVVMPGMDGYEVCRRLKEDPVTQHIPVIFITGRTDIADETRGLEVGAVDYIAKPFNLAIVKARVRTHVELKRQRDVLEIQSTLDGLTGIANRRRFEAFLDQEWNRALRTSSHVSMVMMDIDCFKEFNDHYGHLAGDECLKSVAHALTLNMRRTTDMIARYGGEEFVAVLPATDHIGALQVAQNLRDAVEKLNIDHAFSSAARHVTLSAGVATILPTMHIQPEQLLDSADRALYQAKQAGRNTIVVSDT